MIEYDFSSVIFSEESTWRLRAENLPQISATTRQVDANMRIINVLT